MGANCETERLRAENAQLREKVARLEASESERHRIERTLKDQLRFLQTLIDTIPNPIFYKDKAGAYLGCNKAFEHRMGLDRSQIIGRFASDLYPEEIALRYEQHDLELFANPGEKAYETSITYADGTRHDVIITKGIFRNSEGDVAGLVGVTLDITERKTAETALQNAHDELEERVAARTAALAQANRKLQEEIAERIRVTEELRVGAEKLKIFAYSVAHDLKSPSIGIYGLAKLLQDRYAGSLDEKGTAFCAQIMKASEHVASLVDAINTFIATKETPLRIERVELDEIFRLLKDEFSARLRVRRITLEEPPPGVTVRADGLSMLRVFRNLIDNAVKYGGERLSCIAVRYTETEKFHHFRVMDDGVGIEGKDAGKIFNLFQRRESSGGVEGTGLGLAIVKEIVELHGGEVWVEAAEEGGTVFHVLISKNL